MPLFLNSKVGLALIGFLHDCTILRLIYTRRGGMYFPQWAVSMQRQEIFYLPADTQLSAADACGKRSNLNEPLNEYKILYRLEYLGSIKQLLMGKSTFISNNSGSADYTEMKEHIAQETKIKHPNNEKTCLG